MKTTKIAILQLTRIGDLIQTAQATRQFRAENPDSHITLIARRKFASGLTFLLETVFDEIILFDTSDFFKKKNFSDAKKSTHNFISDLKKYDFDFLINLSFSKSSSYLSSLINTKEILGIHRNSRAEVAINDRWSQYVYSNVMNGANSSFSLVDVYRYILGCQHTHLLDSPEETRSNKIVIHPFASSKKKSWGINKWVELIYKVASELNDFEIHLVGSKQDSLEADRLIQSPSLKKYSHRIFSHTKNYTIADTYQLLMDAKLFIGHDSMVSHLASETLTPGIVLSLGTVRPYETTPYGKNFINIAPKNKCFPCLPQENCDLLPCHNSINYQVVNVIAKGLISGEKISSLYLKAHLTPFHLNTVSIYKTSFRDNTGLEIKEISENYKTIKNVFQDYYKIIWQYYLRNVEIDSSLPDITPEVAKELYEYLNGTNYLFELYNFGVKYSNKIIEQTSKADLDFKLIQEDIVKLGEIDQLCSITKKSYPFMGGLVDYFYVNKANAIGENITDITKHNLLNYYDASNLVSVINDFIEKSVKPHLTKSEKISEV